MMLTTASNAAPSAEAFEVGRADVGQLPRGKEADGIPGRLRATQLAHCRSRVRKPSPAPSEHENVLSRRHARMSLRPECPRVGERSTHVAQPRWQEGTSVVGPRRVGARQTMTERVPSSSPNGRRRWETGLPRRTSIDLRPTRAYLRVTSPLREPERHSQDHPTLAGYPGTARRTDRPLHHHARRAGSDGSAGIRVLLYRGRRCGRRVAPGQGDHTRPGRLDAGRGRRCTRSLPG